MFEPTAHQRVEVPTWRERRRIGVASGALEEDVVLLDVGFEDRVVFVASVPAAKDIACGVDGRDVALLVAERDELDKLDELDEPDELDELAELAELAELDEFDAATAA